ncbi:MAG: AI-2E family transporter, partial [Moraxellaceae bacterium]
MITSDSRTWLWLLLAAALALLVWLLSPILMPFAAGAFLAYLGNPLVQRLTRRGMTRKWAASLSFFTLLAVVTVALVLLIPMLWKQFLYVETKLPT